MNEVFETLASVFEELRSESGERNDWDYYVSSYRFYQSSRRSRTFGV